MSKTSIWDHLNPTRGPAIRTIWNKSQQVQSAAYKYAREVCTDVLGLPKCNITDLENRIYVAEPKSPHSIARKLRDNYNGDSTRIKDGARLTVFTQTPKELEAAIAAFSKNGLNNNRFHRHMQSRSGYTFREDPKDYVTKPKRWGYIALYCVVDHGGIPFEVQIFPENMKPIYDQTHQLYAEVRPALEKWEQANKKSDDGKNVPIRDFLSADEIKIVQQILDMHYQGVKEAGILHLIAGEFPSIDDLPPLVHEPDIPPYPQDDEALALDTYVRVDPVLDSLEQDPSS